MARRVVVTGMGAVTPLGHDPETTWEAILAGRSGMGPITLFDASDFETKIAAEVKDWDPTRFIGYKDARRMDRHQQFAAAAAKQAVANAGLEITDANRRRIGARFGFTGSRHSPWMMNGFVARSSPTVVSGPCPDITRVSSGRVIRFSRRFRISLSPSL